MQNPLPQLLIQKFLRLRHNKVFEFFVISVIILSALLIGAKTYEEIPTGASRILLYFDHAITVIFLIEILVRMLAEEKFTNFFKSGWNIFDFLIVTASLIPTEGSEMVLLGRLLRIFRVLRLISIIPELRILLNAFLRAIPRIGYVSLLMFIIFYIYGAIGSMLFSSINAELWRNISISMLTLFRVITFEDWTDVMYETMEVFPLSWIFYLSFIFLTAFVFLNMMIGIVLEVLHQEHAKAEKEAGRGLSFDLAEIKQKTQSIELSLEGLGAKVDRLLSDSKK